MDCWGGGYNNASNIALQVASDDNDYVSVWAPDDPDGQVTSDQDNDASYGGAWGAEPGDLETSPMRGYGDPSSPPPLGRRSCGISVFDSTLSQVKSETSVSQNNPEEEGYNKTNVSALKDFPELEESMDPSSSQVLNMGMYHAKSNAELKAEKQTKHKLFDFRTETLSILVNNGRGFYGKRESVSAILAREQIDIACFCETLFAGTRFTELQGYNTFFKNRKEKGGGGVAILIKQELAMYAVKVASGEGEIWNL